MKYIITGTPISLQRPRLGARVYDPQAGLKRRLKMEIQIQHGNRPVMDKPLHVDVMFYMPIPKSTSARRATLLEATPHKFKPDIDNLTKLVFDLCNQIVYTDDALISSISAKKIYSSQPRTEFVIREIE